MSRIGGKDTKPEIRVRKTLHASGFRYRLHVRKLPGCPDIVLPKYKLAILVHGCFWHRHENCQRATNPKSNTTFWTNKFAATVERDIRNRKQLAELGWKVVILWECEVSDGTIVVQRVRSAIEDT